MENITEQIKKRRTFAIISHPDAGKTTLTEKFLLYGGAINLAGTVKGRKAAKHAVSDWMEIEKERGISVTSSVLQAATAAFSITIRIPPPFDYRYFFVLHDLFKALFVYIVTFFRIFIESFYIFSKNIVTW